MSENTHDTQKASKAVRQQRPDIKQDSLLTQESLPSASQLTGKLQLKPQNLLALQRTIGNKAVQRMIEKQPPSAAVAQKKPSVTIQPRTVSRKMIQRNIFHKMAKPISKYLTLGSGSDRRGGIDDLDEVKQNNSSFSDVQDVTIANGAHNLKGRYYLGKPLNGIGSNSEYQGYTILFLSGSGGSAEQYSLPLAKIYCASGANLLAVNYRGFGQSTMTKGNKEKKIGRDMITDAGLYSDARAMFNWLSGNGVGPDKIIVHGYSLGGAMASNLVADLAEEGIRVGGLIMHSPLDSVKNEAMRTSPKMGGFAANASGLTLDTIANLQRLAQIPGFANLAIHFMTGDAESGDQLALNNTNLDLKATQMGFTNVTFTQANNANHMAIGAHMYVATQGSNREGGNAQNSVNRLFPAPPVQQPTTPQSSTTQQPTTDTQTTTDTQQPTISDIESQMPEEEATEQELQEVQQTISKEPGKVQDLINLFNQMGNQ